MRHANGPAPPEKHRQFAPVRSPSRARPSGGGRAGPPGPQDDGTHRRAKATADRARRDGSGRRDEPVERGEQADGEIADAPGVRRILAAPPQKVGFAGLVRALRHAGLPTGLRAGIARKSRAAHGAAPIPCGPAARPAPRGRRCRRTATLPANGSSVPGRAGPKGSIGRGGVIEGHPSNQASGLSLRTPGQNISSA